MRKVAGLLAIAEHPNTGAEEAGTCRARAESLMREYRIAEEELISQAVAGSAEPIRKDIDLGKTVEFDGFLHWLFGIITKHCGIRYDFCWNPKTSGYTAVCVGYEMDLRLAEMIWMASRLGFIASVHPEVDPDQTEAENIYRLRTAGLNRQRIALLVFGREGHAEGLRVGKVYREECERRGEPAAVSGRSVNAKTYREVFVREFVSSIRHRLQEARDAADSVGGALVLPERALRVDEAFYALFPNRRPMAPEGQDETVATGSRKSRAVTKGQRAEWNRLYYGPSARAAAGAAKDAAATVELTRAAPKATRLTDEERSALGA